MLTRVPSSSAFLPASVALVCPCTGAAASDLLCVACGLAAGAAASAPAVRVTHLVDVRQPAGDSGRLRISGRLIDVCAELERLAAAEAQAALPRRA